MKTSCLSLTVCRVFVAIVTILLLQQRSSFGFTIDSSNSFNSILRISDATLTATPASRSTTTTQLFVFSSYGDDRDKIMARNNARTCVKSFLTQRAIQSFMFLLEECRDPHSGKWIEDFLGLKNLLEYHGTGAFNISRFESWEMVLLEMMERPKDEVIVSAKRRGRGHGGWSKDNPYLEERWVDFTIDIDPASLAQRILSVRGQIAQEFVQDLDIVISTNNQILDSYFANLKRTPEDTVGNANNNNSPQELASSFDRLTSYILSSNMESQVIASSPFRKGNFDLLYNLCTQASIHELLRELHAAGGDREVSFAWLRDFYVDRVEQFFDGDQPYGRADDFIEEMLLTPPAVRDMGMNRQGKAIVGLIDPLGLAEAIITRRTLIAKKWKDAMGETASDHMQLQKVLLAKIMGKDVDEFKRDVLQSISDRKDNDVAGASGSFD